MRLNISIFAAVLLGVVISSHAEPFSVQLESVAAAIVTPSAGNAGPAAPLERFEAEHSASATGNIASGATGSQVQPPPGAAESTHKIHAPEYLTHDYQQPSGAK